MGWRCDKGLLVTLTALYHILINDLHLLIMFNWENTTPFENQEELTEVERFYMNDLVKKGCEVRYDDTYIYNTEVKGVSRMPRVNLIIPERRL